MCVTCYIILNLWIFLPREYLHKVKELQNKKWNHLCKKALQPLQWSHRVFWDPAPQVPVLKCTLWNCCYQSPCDLVEHNSNFVCNKEVFIFPCQSSKLCRVQWPLEQELCMYQENLFPILTSEFSISSWRRISFWDYDISNELWLLNKKLTPFWLFDHFSF